MTKKQKNKVLQPGKALAEPEYRPDPCNGSVQVYETERTIYVNGEPIERPDGFIFVWWNANGEPRDEGNHFHTREEAERAGREYAKARNAVYKS